MTALFATGFGVAAFFFSTGRLGDNSFLWHLRTGHLILDSGIPHSDPYSFTAAGERWISQSWLAEAWYALLDDLGGGSALRIFVGLVAAAIASLLFLICCRIANDRIRAGVVTVVALFPILLIYNERPLGLGLLFLAVVVWCVELDGSWLGRHPLALLPLFALWVNIHGTWALGIAYLALHVVCRWMEGHRPWLDRERMLVITGAGAVVASALSPYGFANTLFPAGLLTNSEATEAIVEWGSPDFHNKVGYALAAWIVFLLFAWARGNRPGLRDTLVGIVFVVLALWAVRNVGIAVVVTAPLAARALATERRTSDAVVPRIHVAVLVALALFAGLSVADVLRSDDYDLRAYSVDALDSLTGEEWADRNVVTSDFDAAYVIWRQWPERSVFHDDRVDMYPIDVIRDYRTLAWVEDGWEEVLNRWEIDAVVWDSDQPLAQTLAVDPAWELHREFEDSSVFVRSDSTS